MLTLTIVIYSHPVCSYEGGRVREGEDLLQESAGYGCRRAHKKIFQERQRVAAVVAARSGEE